MKLFAPTARATNVLLIIGFVSVGYALYLRYMAIEPALVARACDEGLQSWLCTTRATVIQLFARSIFGYAAVGLAVLNLIRPSVPLSAAALVCASFGIVLYNVTSSSLALVLLVLSFARRERA